jgi:hypothetical protein
MKSNGQDRLRVVHNLHFFYFGLSLGMAIAIVISFVWMHAHWNALLHTTTNSRWRRQT